MGGELGVVEGFVDAQLDTDFEEVLDVGGLVGAVGEGVGYAALG